jgi:ribosomal protein S18 acetylase RimI-like enzyme
MVTIRRATPADAAKLALVGAASFLESFAHDHPGDDLVAHVSEGHAAEAYRDWLRDPAFALWIAEEALGAPVGYAMLGPATLPGSSDGDVELKRIYMLRRWHGGGHGKLLLTHIIENARSREAKRVLLAVYAANHLAQTFYRAQGFSVIGETCFMVGSTAFTDHVMALEI